MYFYTPSCNTNQTSLTIKKYCLGIEGIKKRPYLKQSAAIKDSHKFIKKNFAAKNVLFDRRMLKVLNGLFKFSIFNVEYLL